MCIFANGLGEKSRTILALAIISRIAKSVGNSNWYNKHESNK